MYIQYLKHILYILLRIFSCSHNVRCSFKYCHILILPDRSLYIYIYNLIYPHHNSRYYFGSFLSDHVCIFFHHDNLSPLNICTESAVPLYCCCSCRSNHVPLFIAVMILYFPRCTYLVMLLWLTFSSCPSPWISCPFIPFMCFAFMSFHLLPFFLSFISCHVPFLNLLLLFCHFVCYIPVL